MTSLPVRKSRNFSFTPSKPHKHQRIREYILYCCPVGRFQQQLEGFWHKSNSLLPNSQLLSIPHITLVSFFKAHEDSEALIEAVRNLAEDGKYLSQPLDLELYTSSNFMGFFVREDDANVLKRIALKFVKEVSDSIISDTIDLDHLIACFPYCASAVNQKTSSRCIPKSSRSISLEPHIKNLHLTLAYQFPSEVYRDLVDLVESLDASCANNWELRLYSRSTWLSNGKQVHKVISPHSSREADELELRVGEFVYVNNDAVQNSVDGWTEAISFSSGNYGFVPLNYTERTSETNVWTLDISIPLCHTASPEDIDIIDGVSLISEPEIFHNESRFSKSAISDDSQSIVGQRRRVIVLRHGERVDFAFGNSWTQYSFNDSQTYVRVDLNMPETLPPRHVDDWEKDSPLTTLGNFQAQLVGSSLKSFGVKFSKVIVSPSYRCLQTATAVLSAMGLENELPLNIEYGMFEWVGWYEFGLPSWLTEKELGVIFNVNENYEPIVSRSQLLDIPKETLDDFYMRNSTTMRELLTRSDGDVLIIAHATNLETCTRQLTGKEPRTRADLRNLLMKIPYLAAIAMQQCGDESSYQLIEPPCLTLTHNSCSKFDWRILDDN